MKQQHTFWQAFIAGIFLLCCSGLAQGVFAADRNACSDDIAKFCKNIKPGWQALRECLEEHETQLSDACKDYEASMERPRVESREAAYRRTRIHQSCKDDVSKFCSGPQSQSRGVETCLNEHASELSRPCRDALKSAKGGEEETKKNE
jgi:hypothetical protein